MDHIHEGHQIRRRPPSIQIGLTKPHVAFTNGARKGVCIVDRDLSHMTCILSFDAEYTSVWQRYVHPTPFHFTHDFKNWGKIARQIFLALGRGQDHREHSVSCL